MSKLEEFINLERELFKEDVRLSPEAIENLLCHDYVEFCSSGYVYSYKKGDIFPNKTEIAILSRDFKLQELSKECVLLTYEAEKIFIEENRRELSNRSSIWKYRDGKWKIFFHQGTKFDK